ncbi:TIGR01777 family protein [Acinetobacter sp. ANC 4910]|uniref:TIGR01777 family oxidoreductase n=1 Tax=Acinetobacter sp. ANC 4910 TaxID=2529850 RepID=UPI00103B8265|nr:TIGR01777 family oxidoreductase [Acinetobacter sp. ANC 4910]TCB37553.1 TIGR01777 family protein [Acinetobacter sp. ANC 4910]
MYKPVVLITGASGFIGSYLVTYLLERDFQVIGISRKPQAQRHPDLSWVQHFNELQHQAIDYVINLAGESIAQGRWTEQRKQKLIQSRVKMTEDLYRYLQQRQIFPKCILSGSAVGYYGIDALAQWQQVCTEESPAQNIFMSRLCQQWEQAALADPQQNTKIMRLGVVFGRGGGILPQMLFPIKWNLVGRIGHGRQPVVWVHIQDVLRAVEFILTHETEQKVFNVVAPEKVTQNQFVNITALSLNRHPLLHMPAWVFKSLLGEQSQLILNGQFVQPKALQQAGFEFKFPTLKAALNDLL